MRKWEDISLSVAAILAAMLQVSEKQIANNK